jgi:maleate cis-trans isomerase
MVLSKEKKGELAFQVLKHLARRKGFNLSGKMAEEITEEAKKARINPDEALALAEEIVRSLVDEIFPARTAP